ncbi:benzodiazepine receptor family protein [Mizugakiibacter sediminis]|uniref:Benzodiazepine receptor family protein n=1 Tax=Mizugakiibacter sediminis TaxID=1475481 RepID=A0A0K8QP89_9GAMM|nr:hypothetical protein [Mizugakiibacter sediminis]GAP66693.1 benzodiazepine receptor family protein [Mizugakiibacter sediminis]
MAARTAASPQGNCAEVSASSNGGGGTGGGAPAAARGAVARRDGDAGFAADPRARETAPARRTAAAGFLAVRAVFAGTRFGFAAVRASGFLPGERPRAPGRVAGFPAAVRAALRAARAGGAKRRARFAAPPALRSAADREARGVRWDVRVAIVRLAVAPGAVSRRSRRRVKPRAFRR